jgi:hypothetical protein
MLGQGIIRPRMGASPHSRTLSFMIVSPSFVNKNKTSQDLWRWGRNTGSSRHYRSMIRRSAPWLGLASLGLCSVIRPQQRGIDQLQCLLFEHHT